MAKLSSMFGTLNAALRKDADFFDCALSDITPDPAQPRKHFAEAELERLAESILQVGLLQPLVVRRARRQEDAATPYILVAGERRYRALSALGWERAPVRLYGRQDGHLLASLVENTVRADLNAVELATAYAELRDGGFSTRQIAEAVGKERTHVQLTLRLLELPRELQARVVDGSLAPAAARALLPLLPTPELLATTATRAIEQELSARELRELVERTLAALSAPPREKAALPALPAEAGELQSLFAERFGARCRVSAGKRGLTITVAGHDEAFLGRVCSALRVA